MSEYRINGFEQIKAFYSWVFNNPDKVRPTHISLYLFLLNQGNRANWVEWFKCPYDLAMQGSCIGNNGTYYKCLDELKKWKLIDYKKGLNNYKAPLIKLFVLYKSEQLTEQVTVPLSEQLTEQVSEQQCEQLTEQLPVHIYKLITNNIKLITDNEVKFEKFIESLKENKSKEEIIKEETETKKPLNDEIGILEMQSYADLSEYTKSDEGWIEAICMNFKIKKETVLNELKHFPIAQKALGRENTNLKDFKNHFSNYLAKKANELRTSENQKANSVNIELEKIMKYKADYMASVNGGKK